MAAAVSKSRRIAEITPDLNSGASPKVEKWAHAAAASTALDRPCHGLGLVASRQLAAQEAANPTQSAAESALMSFDALSRDFTARWLAPLR